MAKHWLHSSSFNSKTCSWESKIRLSETLPSPQTFFHTTGHLFLCRAGKWSGVWFIGSRRKDTAGLKQLGTKMITMVWGEKGRWVIFFRQKRVVWELGRATHGPVTTTQDAAGNVATRFLPDMQVKEHEAIWKLGLGSCFSLEAIPASNDVNKAGTVPPFLVSLSLGWCLPSGTILCWEPTRESSGCRPRSSEQMMLTDLISFPVLLWFKCIGSIKWQHKQMLF